MLRTTTGDNGMGQDAANEIAERTTQEEKSNDASVRRRGPGAPDEMHSAELKPRIPKVRTTQLNGAGRNPQPTLTVFCFEAPDSFIGQYVAHTVRALAELHTTVHVFARDRFDFTHPEIMVHTVGNTPGESYLDQVQEFTRQACNAFLREFPAGSDPITLLGYEWSTIPALSLLHGNRNLRTILSLHSLERQRGDLNSAISRKIEEIELTGLREAQTILTHEVKTAEWAKKLMPECGGRLRDAHWLFPAHHFATPQLDPGAIKTRYNVGPIDPTILFIGDLDERHGPDVLMKAVPVIVKNHKQARFIFVGDGSLLWPLRVHARYLLLEHVVRLPGHVADQPLFDLVQAADIIAVPSREQTEWWPILAGWAARRPVVTTNEMARSLDLQHEKDSVLVYPNPGSFVWGVERLLFDPAFAQTVAQRGRQKLDERFGWSSAARQIQDLMGVPQAK